jgi:hypothetical protein
MADGSDGIGRTRDRDFHNRAVSSSLAVARVRRLG